MQSQSHNTSITCSFMDGVGRLVAIGALHTRPCSVRESS